MHAARARPSRQVIAADRTDGRTDLPCAFHAHFPSTKSKARSLALIEVFFILFFCAAERPSESRLSEPYYRPARDRALRVRSCSSRRGEPRDRDACSSSTLSIMCERSTSSSPLPDLRDFDRARTSRRRVGRCGCGTALRSALSSPCVLPPQHGAFKRTSPLLCLPLPEPECLKGPRFCSPAGGVRSTPRNGTAGHARIPGLGRVGLRVASVRNCGSPQVNVRVGLEPFGPSGEAGGARWPSESPPARSPARPRHRHRCGSPCPEARSPLSCARAPGRRGVLVLVDACSRCQIWRWHSVLETGVRVRCTRDVESRDRYRR